MRFSVRAMVGTVAAAAVIALPGEASAEPAVGVVESTLVVFDTTAPSAPYATVAITGLPPGQRIVGIDYRYSPGPAGAPTQLPQLEALAVSGDGTGTTAQVYELNAISGALTAKASTATLNIPDPRASFGVDFNPNVDRLRVVNSADGNFRLNPDNGALAGTDTPLSPAGQQISAVAYDRVATPFAGTSSTTLYGLDPATSSLVTIGGINGTPSPNGGAVTQVGPLGLTLNIPDTGLGFDISLDGTAYATATVAGSQGLYTVNLTTGAATLIGAPLFKLRAFALAPADALPAPPTPPPPPPTPDTTAPKLGAIATVSKLTLKSLLKGVTASVGADEPVSADVALLATPKHVSLGRIAPRASELTLATASVPLGDGVRTVTLKPKRKLVGRPTRKFKVTVRVAAADAAGNETISEQTLTIKP